MADEAEALIAESRSFLKKYSSFLPDTIYYKGWKIVKPNIKTISAIKNIFDNSDKASLCIAEIGVGMGATTLHIAKFLENKGSLHIFDFNESVVPLKKMLEAEGFTNINIHGSSYKKMDSYNWNLVDILKNTTSPIFDYVFLDGAHSFPVDGLAFFLIDMLLKTNGYIDFDDYNWTHAAHITNASNKYFGEQKDGDFGSFMQRTLESYTLPQLQMKQVALVVDVILEKTGRYKSIIPQKVYQKIS